MSDVSLSEKSRSLTSVEKSGFMTSRMNPTTTRRMLIRRKSVAVSMGVLTVKTENKQNMLAITTRSVKRIATRVET